MAATINRHTPPSFSPTSSTALPTRRNPSRISKNITTLATTVTNFTYPTSRKSSLPPTNNLARTNPRKRRLSPHDGLDQMMTSNVKKARRNITIRPPPIKEQQHSISRETTLNERVSGFLDSLPPTGDHAPQERQEQQSSIQANPENTEDELSDVSSFDTNLQLPVGNQEEVIDFAELMGLHGIVQGGNGDSDTEDDESSTSHLEDKPGQKPPIMLNDAGGKNMKAVFREVRKFTTARNEQLRLIAFNYMLRAKVTPPAAMEDANAESSRE